MGDDKNKDKATAKFTILGQTFKFYPIRVAAILTIVLVIIMLTVNLSLTSIFGGTSDEVKIDASGNYSVHTYGRDVLLLSSSSLRAIKSNGQDDWIISHSMTNPAISVEGKYILLADIESNKNSAVLYKGKAQKCEYPIDSSIISAKVNKHGMAVIASQESGYKGKAVVYDSGGNEKVRYNSGEGYITDVAISGAGAYIAVAQMLTDSTKAYSRIQVITTANGEVASTIACGDSMIGNLKFTESDKLVAVTDSQICGYTRKGKNEFSINLTGKNASYYNIENDNAMCVLTRDSRDNSVLEIYSRYGKLRGKYTANGTISTFSVYGDTIIAANLRDVLYISPRGRLKKTTPISHDIKNIGLYGNKSDALVIGTTGADVVGFK